MKKITLFFASLAIPFSMSGQKIVLDSCVDARDGKVYKAVKIGIQTWMAENLSYKCEGSYAFEDQEKNVKKLGRLYSYDVSRNSCPTGWHLPNKSEWNELEKLLDPKEENVVGDKLAKKAYPGYNAVMTGYKNGKGKYVNKDDATFFWGADNVVHLTKDVSGIAYDLYEELSAKDKKNYFPVRCLKD